jgi:hypothetical protein
MVESYSVTYPNASPYQAWRAGFREGVKMSLVDGVLPSDPHPNKLHWHNLHRLKIWASIGAHSENGMWAILGARHGCWKANCTEWNHINVRDFEKLEAIYREVEGADPTELCKHFGDMLAKEYSLKLTLLDSNTSEFVVQTFAEQYQQALEQAKWTLKRNA